MAVAIFVMTRPEDGTTIPGLSLKTSSYCLDSPGDRTPTIKMALVVEMTPVGLDETNWRLFGKTS